MDKNKLLEFLENEYKKEKEEAIEIFQGRQVVYDYKDAIGEYSVEDIFNNISPEGDEENTMRDKGYIEGIRYTIQLISRHTGE